MPLATLTIATLSMFERTGQLAFAFIGWTLVTFVTLIVVYLLYRTALAVGSGKMCIPANERRQRRRGRRRTR